jgi:hypothetical protein
MPWAFPFQLPERDAVTAEDQVGKPDQVTAALVVMGVVDVNRGNAVVLASADDLGKELCLGHLPDAGLPWLLAGDRGVQGCVERLLAGVVILNARHSAQRTSVRIANAGIRLPVMGGRPP